MTALRSITLAVALVACGGPEDTADGSVLDDAGTVRDVGPAGRCERDLDCTNADYCDGTERCRPGEDGADPTTGCVAGEAPCEEGSVCDEEGDRCDACSAENRDVDGDSAISTVCGGSDCDDTNPSIHPDAEEICDAAGVDEDCDDATFGPAGPSGVPGDADGDSFVSAQCCQVTRAGFQCGDDCDDENREVNPDASEICNGVDDNCDGALDPVLEDRDGDGHAGCADLPAGLRDCDDEDELTYPGAAELCDGEDNSCDGSATDEDLDDDGHMAIDVACSGGARGDLPRDDCDDGDAMIFPGATEVCDAVDHDCDGAVDEAPAAASCPVDGVTTYACNAGTCEVMSCFPTHADCNDIDADGCEQILNDEASQPLDTDSCADHSFYGSAVCWADNQFRLADPAVASQAGAVWARRPVHVGYYGFHARVSAAVVCGGSTSTNAAWALVFAEDATSSLGSTGGSNAGVPTAMRGVSVEWSFAESPNRVQARAWSGSGDSLVASGLAPVGLSCDSFTPDQVLDVIYVAPDPSAGRAARLTVAVVEDASPPLILFDMESTSLPSWPAGTLVRFGITASTGDGALIVAFHRLVESTGVCDSPYDGAVRIAGGGASGRLEVYHSGQWGTICEDAFDATDASVACRQLGFASGTARTDVAAGTGPIWLDELACTSSHLGVGTCPSAGWGTHDCTHTEDVGVTCTP